MKTICKGISTLLAVGFFHVGTAQNVGVGTTTPNLARFQIQGSQGSNMFIAQSSASSTGISLFNIGGYTSVGFNMHVPGSYTRLLAGFGGMFQFNSSTGDNTYWLSNVTGVAGSTIGGWFQPFVIQGSGNVRVNNYFGVNANGHPDSGRVIISHNSSTASPTLKLLESSTSDYARLELSNQASARIWHVAGYNDATTLANDRLNFWNSTGGNVMSLRGDGRVGIGTLNTATGFKLSVAGKIICEELKVQLIGAWPDYVFRNDYPLRSLEELESFIQKNQHLPGVLPASEIDGNGVQIGDMQKRSMEKIEELTLYILQQNNKIKSQESRISLLEEKIDELLKK
jgi:hypothetical protein